MAQLINILWFSHNQLVLSISVIWSLTFYWHCEIKHGTFPKLRFSLYPASASLYNPLADSKTCLCPDIQIRETLRDAVWYCAPLLLPGTLALLMLNGIYADRSSQDKIPVSSPDNVNSIRISYGEPFLAGMCQNVTCTVCYLVFMCQKIAFGMHYFLPFRILEPVMAAKKCK